VSGRQIPRIGDIGRRRPIRRPVAVVAAGVVVACVSGCASPGPPPTRRGAVGAVIDAPNYTVVSVNRLSPAPAFAPRTSTTAVIEKPDLVSLHGDHIPGEIAIGPAWYLDRGQFWTLTRASGESAKISHGALLFVDLLDRARDVVRHGRTYVVSSSDASRLLESIPGSQFRELSDVSWSATERDGQLASMRLHFKSASLSSFTGATLTATITATISRVGTSPPITAPPKSRSG
jgi:hypothetical protein